MERQFITPGNLDLPGIKAIFTARSNGDMNNPLKGFNLSFADGNDREAVTRNRNAVASFFNVSPDSLVFPVQKHTNKVYIIEDPQNDLPIEADAVITVSRGIILGVLVADCAPILIYNPKKSIIAAVHAGWRGTALGIIKKTLEVMNEQYNIPLSETAISIGPSIRWCCYEVDFDVIRAIEKETGSPSRYSKERTNGKYCLDIPTANQIQANSLGVKNIWISEECTFCRPGRFYSYRYYRGITGRQGGFIGLIKGE